MNRQERRWLQRQGIGVLDAVNVCQRCGAPICPVCGEETDLCEDCGNFHCLGCEAYVVAPTLSLS